MASIARKQGLSEAQSAFVEELVLSGDKKAAIVAGGYSETNYLRTAGELLRTPEIARALHVEMMARLSDDAVQARRVARKLMDDEAVTPKTRADIAFKLLDRAGFGVPKAAESPRDTKKLSLHELTTDELHSVAEHLEAELAGRAKPVSAPNKQGAASEVDELLG